MKMKQNNITATTFGLEIKPIKPLSKAKHRIGYTSYNYVLHSKSLEKLKKEIECFHITSEQMVEVEFLYTYGLLPKEVIRYEDDVCQIVYKKNKKYLKVLPWFNEQDFSKNGVGYCLRSNKEIISFKFLVDYYGDDWQMMVSKIQIDNNEDRLEFLKNFCPELVRKKKLGKVI